MLEAVFGCANEERVLAFLACREEGYAREIARFFRTGLTPIQKQLERLEGAGVFYSQLLGRTRVYRFNPRYPFARELQRLIRKAVTFYPETEREALLVNRRRPRKAGKPL